VKYNHDKSRSVQNKRWASSSHSNNNKIRFLSLILVTKCDGQPFAKLSKSDRRNCGRSARKDSEGAGPHPPTPTTRSLRIQKEGEGGVLGCGELGLRLQQPVETCLLRAQVDPDRGHVAPAHARRCVGAATRVNMPKGRPSPVHKPPRPPTPQPELPPTPSTRTGGNPHRHRHRHPTHMPFRGGGGNVWTQAACNNLKHQGDRDKTMHSHAHTTVPHPERTRKQQECWQSMMNPNRTKRLSRYLGKCACPQLDRNARTERT
jgi:hypothetical protein